MSTSSSVLLQVFERVVQPVVASTLQGYNGTVFAYGQTGSGKTFTITGGAERYVDRGVIPRTISNIFKRVADAATDYTYQVGAPGWAAGMAAAACKVMMDALFDQPELKPAAQRATQAIQTSTGRQQLYLHVEHVARGLDLTTQALLCMQVFISYLEIYNEVGYDLLDPTREVQAMEDLPQVMSSAVTATQHLALTRGASNSMPACTARRVTRCAGRGHADSMTACACKSRVAWM